MVSGSERAKILEMIEAGTITAEEGLTLLNALGEADTGDEGPAVPELMRPPEETEGLIDEADEVVDGVEVYDLAASELLPADEPGIQAEDEVLGEAEVFADADVIVDEVFVDPGFETEAGPHTPPDRDEASIPPNRDEVNKWKRWWMIPLWVGAAIIVIGGGLMFWAFSANGFGFWFACAWFPFLLGVGLLALAWGSRTSPWLHVRVQQPPGERPRKIAISFPIPIRLTVWGIRMFGHRIPHMENTNLDEVILALKDVARDGTPLSVDVTEGEDGERVQVFIG